MHRGPAGVKLGLWEREEVCDRDSQAHHKVDQTKADDAQVDAARDSDLSPEELIHVPFMLPEEEDYPSCAV